MLILTAKSKLLDHAWSNMSLNYRANEIKTHEINGSF